MARQGTQLLILLAAFVLGSLSDTDFCRNAVAPLTKPRGVNQVDRASATPIFELHVTPVKNDRRVGDATAYKISISIKEGLSSRFKEATLAVTTDGSCGSGDFDYNPRDFVEIVQDHDEDCPRLVQTKRKTDIMTELMPLIWIPPSCGCVQFKLLIEGPGEVYYAENEDVSSGPLAKMVCSKQKDNFKISREHRLDSLCHVIDKHSSSEIMSRSQFQRKREMETRWMDRLGLEMALELRRSDARMCCSKGLKGEREACFENARRRRIDQFCEDGVPDIPFKSFRRNHMRTLEKSCCFILGEFRYLCFSKNSELDAKNGDASVFDYSMDASDVVNDLADFGSHEFLDNRLRPRQFTNEEDDDDIDDDNDDDVDDVDDEEELEDDEEGFEIDEEEEEEDEDEEKNIRTSSIPVKKSFLQRSPPKNTDNKRQRVPLKTSSAPSTAARRGEKLSSKEVHRNMKKASRRRNSMENRRLSSTERGKLSRRMRKRKGGNRGSVSSAERRERMRKTSHRGMNKVFRGGSSKERRSRFEKAELGSRERKGRGHAKGVKQQKGVESDVPLVPYDQGGSSMDRTMKKLQRRMRRLKLRSMCCKAGGEIGGQVYGGKGQVTEECRHSSVKYVRGLDLGHKSKKCAAQFADCCLEEAKKGLMMTSQEFIENTMTNYWDNTKQLDPRLVGSVLSQRGRRTRYPDSPWDRNLRTESSPTKGTTDHKGASLPRRKTHGHEHRLDKQIVEGGSDTQEKKDSSKTSIKTVKTNKGDSGRLPATTQRPISVSQTQDPVKTENSRRVPQLPRRHKATADAHAQTRGRGLPELERKSYKVPQEKETDIDRRKNMRKEMSEEDFDRGVLLDSRKIKSDNANGEIELEEEFENGDDEFKTRSNQQKTQNPKQDLEIDSQDKFGALDSREMAERNKRQFYDKMGAMDSREMADQYIRKPSLFRLKNYKYKHAKPSRNRRRKGRRY